MNHTNDRPVIFLRGLLREQAHWGEFQQHVKKTLSNRQCLFIDTPGNGHFFEEKSPLHVRDISLHIIEQLNTLIPPEQVVDIVSISMGGMIALDLATLAPKRINTVVLINSSLRNFSPLYHRMLPSTWGSLLMMCFSTAVGKELKILAITSNLEEYLLSTGTNKYQIISKKIINEWLLIRQRNPVSLINGIRQLIAAARYQLNVKPNVNLAVINSTCDQLVAECCSSEIAKAWDIELHSHAWAGHDIALDDSQWLCEKIDFLLKKSH